MTQSEHAAVDPNLIQAPTPPALLAAQDVAAVLRCSVRTVYRLIDSKRIPRPVRLGALVRWPREVIEQWIAQGCPATSGRQ